MPGQSLKDANYRFVRFDGQGMAIFQDLTSGQYERFGANAGGGAGWGLQWRGTFWEFCSSCDVPENKATPRLNLERVRDAVERANWRKGYGDIVSLRLFADGKIEAVIRRPHMTDTTRIGRIDGGRVRFAGTSCSIPAI